MPLPFLHLANAPAEHIKAQGLTAIGLLVQAAAWRVPVLDTMRRHAQAVVDHALRLCYAGAPHTLQNLACPSAV